MVPSRTMNSVLLALILVVGSEAGFNLSNTLGDGMVLQREPQRATVWGLGDPGIVVSTNFGGTQFNATVGSDGIWRQQLPATPANKVPQTINFVSSDGSKAALADVLFGDVFMCGGQSNMQYTPHSMAGMNNASAEIASAEAYGATMRFFTVGQETDCGKTDCTSPFLELGPSPGGPCAKGKSCRELWEPASALALGGNGTAWNTFSSVCFLFGREIHDALGGEVPIGLISNNWGGTPIQLWQDELSSKDCDPKQTRGGTLYNSMVAPYTTGPMAITGITWYQGENNAMYCNPTYYSCAMPSLIRRWREALKAPKVWFGLVQIAGFAYSHPYGNPPKPERDHSRCAGDLRQAQLAGLRAGNVGISTAIDTGDWSNIHPADKQNPATRLAKQALVQIYGRDVEGAMFPVFAGSKLSVSGSTVQVTVQIRAGGEMVNLTTDAPKAATQSTTLGKPGSVPRNECVTMLGYPRFPEDCGYPAILGTVNGSEVELNATAAIGKDGSSIVLTATAAPEGFIALESAYGRASWPRTVFFASRLPVLPWHSNFTATAPWERGLIGRGYLEHQGTPPVHDAWWI